MQPITTLLFHLTPILPFAFGYIYGGIAAVLLVCLPYIKVLKFSTTLKHTQLDPLVREEVERLSKRWIKWTYFDEIRRLISRQASK